MIALEFRDIRSVLVYFLIFTRICDSCMSKLVCGLWSKALILFFSFALVFKSIATGPKLPFNTISHSIPAHTHTQFSYRPFSYVCFPHLIFPHTFEIERSASVSLGTFHMDGRNFTPVINQTSFAVSYRQIQNRLPRNNFNILPRQ